MQVIEVLEKLENDGWKKMELFMLHLRFLPWYFLGLLFFIVIFIIMPWHNLALANYYLTIKDENLGDLKIDLIFNFNSPLAIVN